MKKVLSVFLFVIFILNVFPLKLFANENITDANDFFSEITMLADKYDNSSDLSSGSNASIVTNRLIVKTKTNNPLSNTFSALSVVEGYDCLHVLQYYDSDETQYAFKKLSFLEEVVYVEHDFYFELSFDDSDSLNQLDNSNIQWNSTITHVFEALNYLDAICTSCQETTVAVIDSGVYSNHSHFDNKNQNRIIDSGYIYEVKDVDENGNDDIRPCSSMEDDLYHGTTVASVVFDNTMNNIKIVPYRVTNSKKVRYSEVISAFDHLLKEETIKIDVINLSMAIFIDESEECKTLQNYILEAIGKGIVVVACSGNYYRVENDNTELYIPASMDKVITVAATDEANCPAKDFSVHGLSVDISAPGVNINCPSPRAESDLGMGGPCEAYDAYMSCTGTSYAAPLVAALAATLKSINPDATPASIERIIKQSAYVPEDWEENCYGNNYGTGIVNFYNAVQLALKDKTEIIINSDKKFEITPVGWSDSLYYTLDGSEPTPENGVLYTEPLDLSKKVINVIKAASFVGDAQVGETTVYRMTSFKDMKINRGETEKAVSDSYRGKIRWRSDNLAVATVDSEGNVTGVSEGKTNVVATLESGKRIIFNVTVKEQPLYWLIELFEFWLSLFEINI